MSYLEVALYSPYVMRRRHKQIFSVRIKDRPHGCTESGTNSQRRPKGTCEVQDVCLEELPKTIISAGSVPA